jgi:cellulose synthase/poly-beta-1,6-N-acetylglucosamine synthase-like glycosyltransferase
MSISSVPVRPPPLPPPLPIADGDAADMALLARIVPRVVLGKVAAAAREAGFAPHEVLLAEGWVEAGSYVAALGLQVGAPCLDAEVAGDPAALAPALEPHLVDAIGPSPGATAAEVARRRRDGTPAVLALPATLARLAQRRHEAEWLDEATHGLARRQPSLSAGTPIRPWQPLALVLLVGLAAGGLLVLPGPTLTLLTAILVVPFFFVVAIRLLALLMPGARPPAPLPRGRDAELPLYTILVPLYREAAVVPGLVQALMRLDYPKPRLEVLFVLESDDEETRAALAALALPTVFDIVIVPAGLPRTKPRALNFALQRARGRYVAVYDAEDLPEPGQLRMALAAFAADPARIMCVQARLNVDTWRRSWLTRQFAIEYTALFDRLLPALVRLRLPVPLGGTSNHFLREALIRCGGWDAYNVTEDADLGLRIARVGGRIAVIPSTTWEEAPQRLWPWMRQRTRWIKGWMMTWLVHMRRPVRLLRELGPWGFLGFQSLVGGFLFSAFVHPIFYVVAIAGLGEGRWFGAAETTLGAALWWVAAFNLAVGYGAAMALAVAAVVARRRPSLALHALFMPLYWLLVSLAAYRALWQLVREPYHWEKTEHGARPTDRRPRRKRVEKRAGPPRQ